MLHIIKVLLTKSQNNELQESFLPMIPRQLTQGEFRIKNLKRLMEAFRNGKSTSNDMLQWLAYYNWISDSYFFPEKNSFFQEVKKTFILYLKKHYPQHEMLEKLK